MHAILWIVGLAVAGFGIMVFIERVCFRREPRQLVDELRSIIERERSR